MKKFLLSFALMCSLALSGLTYAQKDSLFEDKKDTVSIDDMDPVFYEAEEGKTSHGNRTNMIIGGIALVVVACAGAYYFMKKKKK